MNVRLVTVYSDHEKAPGLPYSRLVEALQDSVARQRMPETVQFLAHKFQPGFSGEVLENAAQFAAMLARIPVLQKLLNNNSVDVVVWLDADTLVRGDISQIWNPKPDWPMIRILRRTYSDERLKVNTGVIVLFNSPEVQQFLLDWRVETEKAGIVFYADQIGFQRALEKWEGRIDFPCLSALYNDSGLNDTARIWHAKTITERFLVEAGLAMPEMTP